MKYCITVLLILVMGLGRAQTPIKVLSVGDKIPLGQFNMMSNGKNQKVEMSSVLGKKLVILDFFASWCKSCITSMKKMVEFKKQHPDRFDFVNVTYQRPEAFTAALKRYGIEVNNLQIIHSDSVLIKYLPYRKLPHVVWVNEKGVIVAITSGSDASHNDLQSYLDKGIIPAFNKVDELDFDISKPFQVKDSGYLYRSVVTKQRPGIFSGSYGDPSPQYLNDCMKRLFIFNSHILNLYMRAAYGFSVDSRNLKRVILNVKDTLMVMTPVEMGLPYEQTRYPSFSHWARDNFYCYEQDVAGLTDMETFFKSMMVDLNRALPVKGRMIMKKQWCYVVKNDTKNSMSLRSAYKERRQYVSELGFIDRFERHTMDEILFIVNYNSDDIPIINETSNKEPFDLEVRLITNNVPENITAFRKALSKSGFKMEKAIRELPILELYDE